MKKNIDLVQFTLLGVVIGSLLYFFNHNQDVAINFFVFYFTAFLIALICAGIRRDDVIKRKYEEEANLPYNEWDSIFFDPRRFRDIMYGHIFWMNVVYLLGLFCYILIKLNVLGYLLIFGVFSIVTFYLMRR